jgi:hypothetical protein
LRDEELSRGFSGPPASSRIGRIEAGEPDEPSVFERDGKPLVDADDADGPGWRPASGSGGRDEGERQGGGHQEQFQGPGPSHGAEATGARCHLPIHAVECASALSPNIPKPIQEDPRESKEKGREAKAKRLGFSWIPSSDSGLFNRLRRFQRKL